MKTATIFLLTILLLTSCQRQPTANFTTDKTEYTAGDTIHFTNTSEDGDSYLWTVPDGKTFTTENLDYVTDVNEHSGSKTFKLDVFSKNKKKNATASKTVIIKQGILTTDYFSVDIITNILNYKLVSKSSNILNGNWTIEGIPNYFYFKGYCQIFFPENHAPTSSSSFTLVSSSNALMPGQAHIKIKLPIESESYFYSSSGQLELTVSSNGKVRAVFTNIPTLLVSGNTYHISGDITCE